MLNELHFASDKIGDRVETSDKGWDDDLQIPESLRTKLLKRFGT